MKNSRRHSIEDLGLVRATRGDIRIEALNDRLSPKVPFPHRHDFYHILVVEQGRGQHRIDFQNYSLQRNQIFFVKPGQVHAWDIASGVKAWVIEFTMESLPFAALKATDILTQLQELPDMFLLKAAQKEKIFRICEIMHAESQGQQKSCEVSLQGFLIGFLVELLRVSGQGSKDLVAVEQTIAKFQLLVEEQFKVEHAVEFYSQSLGLTAKALTMRCQRQLGKSARAVIHERILVEAKRLLIYSKMSVSEVAAQLGYLDVNYFVRFFKEHVEVTPLRFREKHNG